MAQDDETRGKILEEMITVERARAALLSRMFEFHKHYFSKGMSYAMGSSCVGFQTKLKRLYDKVGEMATKIKDGLFIGDAEASQDPEFIELNKIMFVVNCAGRQLPNLWEEHGLHYLTFPWTSDADCVLFDSSDIVITQISNFIDEALEKGDSVLVHSLDGTGRCIACLAAYLMCRFYWGFEKALEFLCSKRPDASPNNGFTQQLYNLDVRLSALRYGEGKEPPKIERLRHDQWVPIVPEPSSEGCRGGSRQVSSSSIVREKSGGLNVVPSATTGRLGVSASNFPSLGRLSEVQEEEIVLVHSFLNGQPQMDALPPGQPDYEDHTPRELHWIDRPRLDKLSTASRLGRNDRRQHMIPVSQKTGRAVPERPGNSSYNALSRNTRSKSTVTGPLVGILKTSKKDPSSGDKDKAKMSQASSLESEALSSRRESSGDDAVVSCSTKSGGSFLMAPLNRHVDKLEDEVVVEDLSDGADVGKAENENTSGEYLSENGPLQGSRIPPNGKVPADSTGPRGTGHGERPSATSATPNESSGTRKIGECKTSGGLFCVGRSAENPRRNSTAASRQAWDGGIECELGFTNLRSRKGQQFMSAKGSGEDNVNSSYESYGGGRGAAGEPRGRREITSRGSAGKNGEAAEKRRQEEDLIGNMDNRKVDDPDFGPADGMTVEATNISIGKQKMLRRGSEGSINFSSVEEVSSSTKCSHDWPSLPQAEGGGTRVRRKATSTSFPGSGWGLATKETQRMENNEDAKRTKVGSFKKENAERGRDSPEHQKIYAPGEGGGSLQQLAKMPDPQQRRLPSPSPHPDHGQNRACFPTTLQCPTPLQQEGCRRQQDAPDPGKLFPQKRTTITLSQRPDDRANDTSGRKSSDNDLSNNAPTKVTTGAVNRLPTSIGSAKQGYPAHGLMPSGSSLQMNGQETSRSGGGAGGNTSSGSRSSQSLDKHSNGIDGYKPGQKKDSNGVPLPRELRAHHPPAISVESSRLRRDGSTGPPHDDHPSGFSCSAHLRSLEDSRGSVSKGDAAASRVNNGVPQQNAGSLPLPSRMVGNTGGSGSGGVRWANPVLCGRHGDTGGPGAPNLYPRPIDRQGIAGSDDSGPKRSHTTSAQGYPPSLFHHPQAQQGAPTKPGRAGGVPLYRSGSPAPTRGRSLGDDRPSSAKAGGGIENPESILHRQRTSGRQPHKSNELPPGFRGYVTPSIGGRGNGTDRGTTASHKSQIPLPKSREGRRRAISESFTTQNTLQRDDALRGVPPKMASRPSTAQGFLGQRPSTSDGFTDGSVGGGVPGRRRMSSSPAPRPSSASARRRSFFRSMASTHGRTSFGRSTSKTNISMDTGFDRPRWK